MGRQPTPDPNYPDANPDAVQECDPEGSPGDLSYRTANPEEGPGDYLYRDGDAKEAHEADSGDCSYRIAPPPEDDHDANPVSLRFGSPKNATMTTGAVPRPLYF